MKLISHGDYLANIRIPRMRFKNIPGYEIVNGKFYRIPKRDDDEPLMVKMHQKYNIPCFVLGDQFVFCGVVVCPFYYGKMPKTSVIMDRVGEYQGNSKTYKFDLKEYELVSEDQLIVNNIEFQRVKGFEDDHNLFISKHGAAIRFKSNKYDKPKPLMIQRSYANRMSLPRLKVATSVQYINLQDLMYKTFTGEDIPSDKILINKDGISGNCELSQLILVSIEEFVHMYMTKEERSFFKRNCMKGTIDHYWGGRIEGDIIPHIVEYFRSHNKNYVSRDPSHIIEDVNLSNEDINVCRGYKNITYTTGIYRVNKLNYRLIQDKRYEELFKSTYDTKLQRDLMREYLI